MTPAERIKSGAARPWLPESALSGDFARRILAELISNWSAKWISAGAVAVAEGFRPVAAAPFADGGRTLAHPEGLALWTSDETELALAGMMLDRRIERGELQEADRALVIGLAERALDDLGAALASAFGLGHGRLQRGTTARVSGWDAPCRARLAAADQVLVELVAETDLLVGLIRNAAAPDTSGHVLSLSDGLRNQVVEVGAILGRSRARLDELATLQPGDVLLLEGDLSEPVEVAFDGMPSPLRCVIDGEEASLRLRLVE